MRDRLVAEVDVTHAGYEAWRHLVEAGLKGQPFSSLRSRTSDGVVIEPLYAPAVDAARLASRRAETWIVVQLVGGPDPDAANRQALADLTGGATGLQLRFEDSLAGTAGLPFSEAALRHCLEGVDLAAIQLRIDPHPDCASIALWMRDLVARAGVAPTIADIAFGLDPVSHAAGGRAHKGDQEKFVSGFMALGEAGFRGGRAVLDTRLFHETGATDGQALAAMLASGAWWLRELDAAGVAPESALTGFGAVLPIGRDVLQSIAMLRGTRLVWARFCEVCGVAPSHLPIHAETSRRMMTRAEPHTNIVRTTLAAFSAAVGGADSILILAFDAALGSRDPAARALARNTHHLLNQESRIGHVIDPAAGSGAVEALTDALAERAWDEFRRIEAEGGIMQSLARGGFRSRIALSRQTLRGGVADGRERLVGVTDQRDATVRTAASGESADSRLDRPRGETLEDMAQGLR